jgi:hypothetical protein
MFKFLTFWKLQCCTDFLFELHVKHRLFLVCAKKAYEYSFRSGSHLVWQFLISAANFQKLTRSVDILCTKKASNIRRNSVLTFKVLLILYTYRSLNEFSRWWRWHSEASWSLDNKPANFGFRLVFNWVELISRSKTAFREISWQVLNIALQRVCAVSVTREHQMRHQPLLTLILQKLDSLVFSSHNILRSVQSARPRWAHHLCCQIILVGTFRREGKFLYSEKSLWILTEIL